MTLRDVPESVGPTRAPGAKKDESEDSGGSEPLATDASVRRELTSATSDMPRVDSGTPAQLKAWADEQIIWGDVNQAREVYATMGLEIPASTLVAAGERHLARGDYRRGMAIYAAAGVEVPAETLIACGDKWVQELLSLFNPHDAYRPIEAYEAAGARSKLLELRDRFIRMQWSEAAEAARAAAERLDSATGGTAQ